MATIYQHKNNFFPPSTHHNSPSKQPLKNSHKLSVNPNIFATEYHIKEVHLIGNGAILYQTVINNQKHIIHQVEIDSQSEYSRQNLIQLIKFAQKPYVDRVYFQTDQVQAQSYLNRSQAQKTQQILKVLESSDKVKCHVVINSSIGLQQNINQKLNRQDFLSVLNQFLTIIDFFNQTNVNLENSLLLRNSLSSSYVIHHLDILIPDSYNKLNPMAIQTIIKQYMLISLAKNLKDFLNHRSKSLQTLFNLFEAKHPQIQFTQFTSLLREAIQNKRKFTHKMLICYIEILKEKCLKSKEEKEIFKHISNHQSIHQPPQKDYSPPRRQKQSNSFINSHQQKTKSFSRKLQLNKENDITDQNHYRRSDGPKSSSMISMSPNRKNRKYMKCTTTSLFSKVNQSLERTSSTSFLFKTTNGFNRNSSSSSFLGKDYLKTCVSSTQSNFFKNNSTKNEVIPESNVKGYLQMMGFKSKGKEPIYKKSDSIVELHQKCVQNQRIDQRPSHQSSHVTESKLLSQSSFNRPESQQNHENNPINQKSTIDDGSIIHDADEKKLRLKQSLNLLSRKSLKGDNLIPSNLIQGEEPQQFKKRKEQRHNLIIPECEKTQQIEKIPSQKGPITTTVIHKERQADEITIQKSLKFKICILNEMDIKIAGCDKSKKLKIDRSTVMVMHLVNLDRRLKTQSTTRSFQNQRTSREKDEQFKSKEEPKRKSQKQVTFKPSLASVKKQKPLEKIQKIEKSLPNDSLSNRSIFEQKSQKPIQEQLPTNKSLKTKTQVSKNNIETSKQVSQTDNLQTSYLTKSNTSKLIGNQSLNTSIPQQQQFQLSKQFFKQIFLFINSENKTLVDLLESKLSYEITFYAFYINYFKLNVNKSASKQSIDRMKKQINDYQAKIKESQKITSKEKMLPEFEPFVKKLLSLNMESFVEKFWKRDQLKQKEKENAQKISDQVDNLTTGILNITMKIIQANISQLRCNQKQLPILLKGLKICATIGQLVYSVQNKLITLSSVELKKITQMALESQSGYEKQWVQTIGGFQHLINTYNGWGKQAETDGNIKISTKNENKKLWALLGSQ